MSMRYALFFTPPRGSQLLRLAQTWLGRDAFADIDIELNPVGSLSPEAIFDFSSFPRLYGFHATLKAPFRLHEAATPDALHAATDGWAGTTASVTIPSLKLERLGKHFALMANEPSQELSALAESCVRHFEPFRAQLTDAEVARRKPAALTEKQRGYLHTFGYPYIFDEFRFHMTLTRAVRDKEVQQVETALHQHFAPVIGKPLAIDGVGLFCQPDSHANFKIERYVPLTGTGGSA